MQEAEEGGGGTARRMEKECKGEEERKVTLDGMGTAPGKLDDAQEGVERAGNNFSAID